MTIIMKSIIIVVSLDATVKNIIVANLVITLNFHPPVMKKFLLLSVTTAAMITILRQSIIFLTNSRRGPWWAMEAASSASLKMSLMMRSRG